MPPANSILLLQRGGLDSLLQDPTVLPDASWDNIKLAFALDVARGLAHCSTLDPVVIHRDVKGANCLVTGDFSAKVADFGAARRKAQGVTQTMSVIGTPLWCVQAACCFAFSYNRN